MRIELEVTLRCNARCPQCSRHCDRMPMPDSDMTPDQVMRFAKEVYDYGRPLELVSIMGGEPSLHPRVEDLADIIGKLRDAGLVQRIVYATNGLLPLPRLPQNTDVYLSPPSQKRHRRMDVDPGLEGQKLKETCPVPSGCGIALNAYGYWPCGAGGAIARLLHMPVAKFTLQDALLGWDYGALCPHCQAMAETPVWVGNPRPASPNFAAAFAQYTPYNGARY